MVKIKFKKQVRKNIFQPNRVVTVSFRTPTTLGRTLVGKQQHAQRYVASMKKVSKPTSLWNPSMNRPGAAFWGDSDGDGVYNGLDCEPHNPKKQGPYHRKTLTSTQSDQLFKAGGTPLIRNEHMNRHAQMFGQDGEYIGDEEQSFMNADEDREFEEQAKLQNDWLAKNREAIEHKEIHDFGVNFNLGTRQKLKAKSTKSDSDDAQSLIDLS